MTIVPRWARARLGRRGAALLILALTFLVIGVRVIVAPATPDPSDRFLLHTLIPPFIRAAIWIVPSIAAIVASCKRGTGRDGFGFAALTVPLIVMSFSYLWSVFAYVFGISIWSLGWSSASTWLLVLGLVLVIAGWPEVPSDRTPKHERKGAHSAIATPGS